MCVCVFVFFFFFVFLCVCVCFVFLLFVLFLHCSSYIIQFRVYAREGKQPHFIHILIKCGYRSLVCESLIFHFINKKGNKF